MGLELARKRSGRKTQTGMTAQQLEDFATKRKAARPPPSRKANKAGGY